MRERLVALRILIGTYALVYTLARFPEIVAVTRLPESQFHPRVGIAFFWVDPFFVIAIAGTTCVLLVMFILGWRYRDISGLTALGLTFTFSYRSAWGQIFHTENLLVLHIFALAAAPAADREDTGKDYASWVKLLAALTVLTYVGVLPADVDRVPASAAGGAFLPLLPVEKLLQRKLRL
jgi:hypothetical protein